MGSFFYSLLRAQASRSFGTVLTFLYIRAVGVLFLKKNQIQLILDILISLTIFVQLMKRKHLLFCFTMALAVLFSILFQSFHGYEHLNKQLSHKICNHGPSQNKTELTHQHQVFEICTVCTFQFNSFIDLKFISYHCFSDFRPIPFFSKEQKEIISFFGSLYTYRGPPASIV